MEKHVDLMKSDTHVLETTQIRFTGRSCPGDSFLKLNLPDPQVEPHIFKILKDGGEVLKLMNFKEVFPVTLIPNVFLEVNEEELQLKKYQERGNIKAFQVTKSSKGKSMVGPKSQVLQDAKFHIKNGEEELFISG
ncbi:hypothetical protein Tco_0365405 [Tanacetum coccineum]